MTTIYDLTQALRGPDLRKDADASAVIGEVYLIADLIAEANRRIGRLYDVGALADWSDLLALADSCETEKFATDLTTIANTAQERLDDADQDLRDHPFRGLRERGSVG